MFDNIKDKLSNRQIDLPDSYFKPTITKVVKEIKRDVDSSGMKKDKLYNTYTVYFNKPRALYNQPHHYTVRAGNYIINLVEIKNTFESPVSLNLKGFERLKTVNVTVTIYYDNPFGEKSSDKNYTSDEYTIEL